jgi:hypothetical protein
LPTPASVPRAWNCHEQWRHDARSVQSAQRAVGRSTAFCQSCARTSSTASQRAPASSSFLTTSRWPPKAALCKGVQQPCAPPRAALCMRRNCACTVKNTNFRLICPSQCTSTNYYMNTSAQIHATERCAEAVVCLRYLWLGLHELRWMFATAAAVRSTFKHMVNLSSAWKLPSRSCSARPQRLATTAGQQWFAAQDVCDHPAS